MKTIYLSGGIDFLPANEVHDWREQAKRLLAMNFTLLDPTRHQLVTPAQLVADELIDISICDILLVRAHKPSWGTAMEIFYAKRCGKKVVAWGIEDANNMSVWLKHHVSVTHKTLDEAALYLIQTEGM